VGICVKSLWFDYDIKSTQELLDEIFIYVHTIKEPSSEFHEQINALKTILELQEEFNNTKDEWKYGSIYKPNEISDYLINSKRIGFSGNFVKKGTSNLLNQIKIDEKKEFAKTLNEPLSEIISTKAVIHSENRKIEKIKEETSSDKRRKYNKKMKLIFNEIFDDDEEREKYTKKLRNYKINISLITIQNFIEQKQDKKFGKQ